MKNGIKSQEAIIFPHIDPKNLAEWKKFEIHTKGLGMAIRSPYELEEWIKKAKVTL